MTFDDLLADFHRDKDALGPRGRGVRYPADFVANTGALVSLLREHGWTQHTIAQTLGISSSTLLRWSARDTTSSPAFAPVEVLDEQQTAPPCTSKSVTLISPTGWRLEGLDAHAALDLLSRLPC